MSDHMNEAVNYIKHLEKKVKDLDAKRHELKRVSDLASVGSRTKPAAASISHHCFIIRPCLIGIEIMFRCGVEDQDLSSSRVLVVLVDEGLHVVSCFSTKSEEFLFHSTIQTEVGFVLFFVENNVRVLFYSWNFISYRLMIRQVLTYQGCNRNYPNLVK